jgi:hypothetical protein
MGPGYRDGGKTGSFPIRPPGFIKSGSQGKLTMIEKLVDRIKNQLEDEAVKALAVSDVIGNAAFFLHELTLPSEHREELKRRLWENLRILHDEIRDGHYCPIHAAAAVLAVAIESLREEAVAPLSKTVPGTKPAETNKSSRGKRPRKPRRSEDKASEAARDNREKIIKESIKEKLTLQGMVVKLDNGNAEPLPEWSNCAYAWPGTFLKAYNDKSIPARKFWRKRFTSLRSRVKIVMQSGAAANNL